MAGQRPSFRDVSQVKKSGGSAGTQSRLVLAAAGRLRVHGLLVSY